MATKGTGTRRASSKVQSVQRGDNTAEAKRGEAAKQEATKKQFSEADLNAAVGLPPEITREQRENLARRAATGF